jgi:hypothetical protein
LACLGRDHAAQRLIGRATVHHLISDGVWRDFTASGNVSEPTLLISEFFKGGVGESLRPEFQRKMAAASPDYWLQRLRVRRGGACQGIAVP